MTDASSDRHLTLLGLMEALLARYSTDEWDIEIADLADFGGFQVTCRVIQQDT